VPDAGAAFIAVRRFAKLLGWCSAKADPAHPSWGAKHANETRKSGD